MNPQAGVAFVAAAVFAVGDWLAVARRGTSAAWQRTEYVCKPATMVGLVAATLALDPSDGPARTLFVVALLLAGINLRVLRSRA